VEELRTLAQHQLAVHPSSIFGCAAQEIVNTLLDDGEFQELIFLVRVQFQHPR
jgi:hypothetical protein